MTDEQHIATGMSPEAEASGDGAPVEATTVEEAVPVEAVSPEAELEAALSERDDYLDQLRRVSAEFANYKKRMAREQVSITERATERLVKELLPVHDDLERAVVAIRDVMDGGAEAGAGTAPQQSVAEGVELVHRSLRAILEREGVVAIEPDGEAFDPHRHEALLSQPSDAPEGTVVQVVQKGFQLGDRVVRPARVVVAAPKD
jgi:molecular chaperone GrpE